MDKKIQFLSETLVNKIAAGEVIENPASVVKELIDNAIDAKADKIKISIKQGGLLSICVEDNGKGMGCKDLQNCILRHATSKITAFEDLWALDTLGFRGEALSSICAVAKVQISSAERENIGYQTYVVGGNVHGYEECVRAPGTTVLVQQLFFNTPARKEFQKSPSANLAEIWKTFTYFVLSCPTIHFSLFVEDKLHTHLVAYPTSLQDSLRLRIKDVLGKEFVATLKWGHYEEEEKRLYGYFGLPKHYKKNRLGQYIFLNGRQIFSSFISSSMKQAYGTRIPEKHYPVFVLFLELPKTQIDYNVHPQKKEVRLQKKEELTLFIQTCIKKLFSHPIPSPMLSLEPQEKHSPQFFLPKEVVKKEVQTTMAYPKKPTLEYSFLKVIQRYCVIESEQLSTYLSLESNDLLLADLQEIFFLLIYKNCIENKKSTIEGQILLSPLIIELTPDRVIYVQSYMEFFTKWAFTISIAGKSTIFVERIPSFFSLEDAKEVIELLAKEDIEEFAGKITYKKFMQKFALRKKNWHIKEVKIMLQELMHLEDPLYSPGGKPTLIQWKEKDITKLFMSKKAPICLQ